ncbi:MAG: hypothetical protein ABI867_09360 [Kofleriaceae bacterium]
MHRFAVLEDDYDHEFHYEARPIARARGHDQDRLVGGRRAGARGLTRPTTDHGREEEHAIALTDIAALARRIEHRILVEGERRDEECGNDRLHELPSLVQQPECQFRDRAQTTPCRTRRVAFAQIDSFAYSYAHGIWG